MNCPSCNSTVVVGYQRSKGAKGYETLGDYVAWCPSGKCTSKAANEGGRGSTVDKAFEDLCAKVEKEQSK